MKVCMVLRKLERKSLLKMRADAEEVLKHISIIINVISTNFHSFSFSNTDCKRPMLVTISSVLQDS